MNLLLEVFTEAFSIVASGVLAYAVAKCKAKNEMKKFLLTIDREDAITFRAHFTRLVAALDNLIDYRFEKHQKDALKACTDCILVAPANCRESLLELDDALRKFDLEQIHQIRNHLLSLKTQSVKESTN